MSTLTFKRIIRLVPIIVLTIVMIYSWYMFIAGEYSPTLKHKIGLGLFIVNIAQYFFSTKIGIIGTGIFLVAGTLNLIATFPAITTAGINLGDNFIGVQWNSLWMLILYFCCTGSYLLNLYWDYKETKKK